MSLSFGFYKFTDFNGKNLNSFLLKATLSKRQINMKDKLTRNLVGKISYIAIVKENVISNFKVGIAGCKRALLTPTFHPLSQPRFMGCL